MSLFASLRSKPAPRPSAPSSCTRRLGAGRGLLAALGLALAGACALPRAAQGQLYISFIQSGRVGAYDPTTGAPINLNVITATFPGAVAMSGDNLYLTNVLAGTVSTYDFNTGGLINPNIITGLTVGQSVVSVISGSNLYVGDVGGLRQYNISTGIENPSFITGFTPVSVLDTAGGLVVSSTNGNVGLYDAMTGAVINPGFLGGTMQTALALSGNNIYAHNFGTGVLSVFDATTGAIINPALANVPAYVLSMVAYEGRLYLADYIGDNLLVYDATTGAQINPSLVTGSASPDLFSLFLRNFDSRPQISAQTSGLGFGNATGQALLGSVQGMLADINGHLFSLRAGGGDDEEEDDDNDNGGLTASLDEGVTMGQGDGPEGGKNPVARKVARSSQWEVFTTVNFANVSLDTMGTQPGVDSYTWSPGVGVEKRVAPGLTLGFAANLMESHQTYSNGLGTLETEGFALSTYASYVKRDYWIDLLYSFGRFNLEAERNPGFAFPMARGETTAYTNAVQLNGGWKFHVPSCKVTHGPFAGVDYLNVNVGDYNEQGGGAAALNYASRSIDSLITRVGYSVSKRIDASFATITPQLRVSYERQNISNNNGTSVSLINQPFTANSNAQSPGQDYLVAGAGVNFEFSPALSLMLTYQGQFFRSDMQAHYAGVRLGWKF